MTQIFSEKIPKNYAIGRPEKNWAPQNGKKMTKNYAKDGERKLKENWPK